MKRVRIGGQAVIEGVMMKNRDKYAVAVRKPDNDIEIKVSEYRAFGDRYPLFKLPIIRGVVNFIESLVIGVSTLTYSASFLTTRSRRKRQIRVKRTRTLRSWTLMTRLRQERRRTLLIKIKKKRRNSDNLWVFLSVAVSVIFAVALFMMLPAFMVELISKVVSNHVALSLIEGVIRLAIFLGYVAIISLMKDIQRVFMYHGAEHKSINCLEAGDPLTPENVKKHSRYHKRCGTSFLFMVMIISIIVFMFIKAKTMWLRMLLRLLLVPVVAGVSYEFIMLTGKSDSKLAYYLSVPGMWVQRLTTREPDLEMCEVAIKSVEAVLDWRAYEEAMHKGELE